MFLIVVWAFFVTVGLLVLATPLFVLAWKKERIGTVRNFAIVAAGIGVLCGSLAGISERQVAQCLAVGNAECFDSGTAGLQLVFIGFYTLIAWFTAYTFYQE